MRTLKLAGVLAGAVLLLPGGAEAATLSHSGGTLTYTGGPGGAASAVGFAEVGAPSTTVDVYRFLDIPNAPPDGDPITGTLPGTCAVNQDTAAFISYRCTGVTAVVANTGDGPDQIDAGDASGLGTVLASIEFNADLGDGDDFAAGGQVGDTVEGGDGNDTLFLDSIGEAPSGAAVPTREEAAQETMQSSADAAPMLWKAARARTRSPAVPVTTTSAVKTAPTRWRPGPAPIGCSAATATTRSPARRPAAVPGAARRRRRPRGRRVRHVPLRDLWPRPGHDHA